jgi:hypothetical protein
MGGRSSTTRKHLAAAIAGLFIVGLPVSAEAQPLPRSHIGPRTFLATFDSLPEGEISASFTDGGIHFFGMDIHDPGQIGIGTFFVDWAEEGLSGMEGFSPPNVMGTASALGPEVGFGRIGEFRMSVGHRARRASVGFFDSGITPNNIVTLEAIRRGRVVARDSVAVSSSPLAHHVLRVSRSRFDQLRLTVTGDLENGVVFAAFDNILIAS